MRLYYPFLENKAKGFLSVINQDLTVHQICMYVYLTHKALVESKSTLG
jgi:phosphoribosyl-AMP cyclohydrolase